MITTTLNIALVEGVIDTPILDNRTKDSNRSVCNFVLHTENTYKSKKYNKDNNKEYKIKKRIAKIPIVAWSGKADLIYNNFQQGDLVRVKGEIRTKLINDINTFEINLDENPLKETVIICRSDLSKYSYEIYFFDAQLTNNNEVLIRYWSDSKNSESILLINIETKKVTESNENLQSRSSYKVNSQGERILDYWEGRNPESRNISLYYQKDNEVIEVFSETAPTNYYFESSNWSQSGNNIVALDSEGQIILFSKNKTYQPTKLIYEKLKHGDQDDSRIVSVIGWRD